jgi:hypothetical protein
LIQDGAYARIAATTGEKGKTMAVVLQAQGAGLAPTEYDAPLEPTDWENQPAAGGVFYVARFDDEGLRVLDVWETEQAWKALLIDRLMPALAKLGVTEGPPYSVMPAYPYFNTESARSAA